MTNPTDDTPGRDGSRADPLPRRRAEESVPPAVESAGAGDTYRVVTDLVTGPNLRWRDNLFQAVFMLLAVATSAGVGMMGWGIEGAVIGGAGGLIGGLLLSGAVLGVYRAWRHVRGRHD